MTPAGWARGQDPKGLEMARVFDLSRQHLGANHATTLEAGQRLLLCHLRDGRLREARELTADLTAQALPDPAGSLRTRELDRIHNFFSWSVTILSLSREDDKARERGREYLGWLRARAGQAKADSRAFNDYAWKLCTVSAPTLRDPAAALPWAKEAVDKSGQNPLVLDTLAVAYAMNGHIALAVETQRKAMQRLPSERITDGTSALSLNLVSFLRRADFQAEADRELVRLSALFVEGRSEHERQFIDRMIKLSLSILESGEYTISDLPNGIVYEVRAGVFHSTGDIVALPVSYAEMIDSQGQHAAAEAILREALEVLRLTLGETSWQFARATGLLGASLSGQGKHDGAEPLLLDAYERTRTAPEAPADEVARACTRLVELDTAWGKPDQAARWPCKPAPDRQ